MSHWEKKMLLLHVLFNTLTMTKSKGFTFRVKNNEWVCCAHVLLFVATRVGIRSALISWSWALAGIYGGNKPTCMQLHNSALLANLFLCDIVTGNQWERPLWCCHTRWCICSASGGGACERRSSCRCVDSLIPLLLLNRKGTLTVFGLNNGVKHMMSPCEMISSKEATCLIP